MLCAPEAKAPLDCTGNSRIFRSSPLLSLQQQLGRFGILLQGEEKTNTIRSGTDRARLMAMPLLPERHCICPLGAPFLKIFFVGDLCSQPRYDVSLTALPEERISCGS